MVGPSFMLNARDLILNTLDLTSAELGEYMIETCRLMQDRKFNQVKKRIGVGHVFKGTQKRAHIPVYIKRQVLSIGYCLYCGSTEKLTVDHIYPVSKGGGNEIENLQCLCFSCNLKKSNKV